jgi:membrane-associated protease RseP (regulator of RpoE activity)
MFSNLEDFMKFGLLVLMVLILIIIHELGHYLAYKIYGIPAHFRKSLLAPGISPNETIVVTKMQGIVIGLSGFVFSTVIFVFPSIFVYPLWKALLVGSVAGSIVDFIWAFSMIFSNEIVIQST